MSQHFMHFAAGVCVALSGSSLYRAAHIGGLGGCGESFGWSSCTRTPIPRTTRVRGISHHVYCTHYLYSSTSASSRSATWHRVDCVRTEPFRVCSFRRASASILTERVVCLHIGSQRCGSDALRVWMLTVGATSAPSRAMLLRTPESASSDFRVGGVLRWCEVSCRAIKWEMTRCDLRRACFPAT
ncbi:hypothetical protein C8R43DRAFT_1040079 [Mycena crocata]|nr:hypothetical protein C8R43DRAFT_1040079 [Mycena crocata]